MGNRRQHFALWLALAAVFFRALIPAGFMPATQQQARDGAVLVLCSGELLKTQTQAPGKTGVHAYSECAFAAAAAPTLPPTNPAAPAFVAGFSSPPVGGLHSAPSPQLALPPARGPPLAS